MANYAFQRFYVVKTKESEMNGHFAAVDKGTLSGAVYGLGMTREEAVLDACRLAGDLETDYDVIPCTAEAYRVVMEEGGLPGTVHVNENGVMTNEEREEAVLDACRLAGDLETVMTNDE